ncbi:WD repeat-containing protein 17 [Lamellibrachia satsuma]|nr:WD repeat-containing protein 17 [Lamellibrachia satsuma]
MVCARCGETLDEINILHEKAGFPALDECLTLAESLRTEDSVLECVQYYLLSSSPELGLEIGLKSVKNVMSGTRWQADDVWGLLQLMASVRTEKLQQHQCSGLRNELMTLCAYVGALMAVRRGYSPIVVPLFKHVELLLRKEAVDLPLSISRVLSQMEAWQACQVSTDVRSASEEVFLSPDQQEHYDELMRRAGPESLFLGPDVVSSSHLPSHMKVYKSHLTGQIIRGPVYFLEDGRSAISISDAVMWAKVNPFSPFGSGLRINPF